MDPKGRAPVYCYDLGTMRTVDPFAKPTPTGWTGHSCRTRVSLVSRLRPSLGSNSPEPSTLPTTGGPLELELDGHLLRENTNSSHRGPTPVSPLEPAGPSPFTPRRPRGPTPFAATEGIGVSDYLFHGPRRAC